MSIVLDIAVIGVIILSTFIGYKQGLVKVAIKILSFFIAIIIALVIYKPVSSTIINNTSIDENIENVIIDKLEVQGTERNEEIQINDNLASKIVGETNTTIEEIARAFSIKLIETITLLLIFIIAKICIRFVTILTDLITKLPLIKEINKLRTE